MLLAPGWAAYMRRMLREEIHILDPLCAQVVGAEQMHMVHQEAVSQIHTTLFSCLVAFFAKWRCPSDRWKRRFPKITCDICTSDESGMCMLHAIKLYDGNKMMWPSTKLDLLHALKSYRNIWLLFGKQLLSRSFVWAMSMAIVCVLTHEHVTVYPRCRG